MLKEVFFCEAEIKIDGIENKLFLMNYFVMLCFHKTKTPVSPNFSYILRHNQKNMELS